MKIAKERLRALRPAPGILALLCAAGLIAAATAAAAVTVYNNNFSSAAEAKELRATGGKQGCNRKYAAKGNAVRVRLTGKRLCAYEPPVEGDGDQPNLAVQLDGRIADGLPKALRKQAYLAASVRGGYTLRVFPAGKRYELVRRPKGGGGEFPASGRNAAIGRPGERNRLSLTARGAQVVARVNGEAVARVRDQAANEVGGRGVSVGVGSRKNAKRPTVGNLQRVKVSVPTR